MSTKTPQTEPVAEQPKQESTFDLGSETCVIVKPHGSWRLFAPGFQTVVDHCSSFSVFPHPTEGRIAIIRPTNSSDFDILGSDIAEEKTSYTFTAYGDGTATLTNVECQAGATLFVPGIQYGDSSVFDIANSGFWNVERIAKEGIAHLRRVGPGGAGVSQTVEAMSASDLQLAQGLDCGSALIAGPLAGLWPIAMATSRWVGLSIPREVQETHNLFFDMFALSQSRIQKLTVEVDRMASVGINGDGSGIVVRPENAGLEAEMALFSLQGFVLSADIKNLSDEPMKLRVRTTLGK